jgi:hypothetical protein
MIGKNICDSVVRATREANKKTLETASRLGMCVYQKVDSDLCRIYPDKIVIVKPLSLRLRVRVRVRVRI